MMNNYKLDSILLIDNDNNGHLFDLLEKKYSYTLIDFYEDTGKESDLYPENILSERFKIGIEEKNMLTFAFVIGRIGLTKLLHP